MLVTDKLGNTLRHTITMKVQENLFLTVFRSASGLTNKPDSEKPISAFHAELVRLVSKCKLNSTKQSEFISNLETVAALSANHQELTLKNGVVIVLQRCTARDFAPVIIIRDFQPGCKIMFAGFQDKTPNRYIATKIFKIAEK